MLEPLSASSSRRVVFLLLVALSLCGACENDVSRDALGADAQDDGDLAVGASCTTSAPCPTAPTSCTDLAEYTSWRWSARADDNASSTRTVVTTALDVVRGTRAMRLSTASGSFAWLRYQAPTVRPIDARGFALELVVRGKNVNAPTWQGFAPVIRLEDASGRTRTLVPDRALLSDDGATWTRVSVPLGGGASARGGASFLASGFIDLASLRAIQIGADTWGAGFSLDVDSFAFVSADAAADGCTLDCPGRCSRQGTCDQETLACACDVGAFGAACEQCAAGFIDVDASTRTQCALENDASHDEWPNETSRANSDPWLAVHHDEIATLRPKALVLNFVNPSTPAAIDTLIGSVMQAFSLASEPVGGGEPALAYELARSIVDLRDGVGGRPNPPAGYALQNSTLMPRMTAPDGAVTGDYRALFGDDFARHYGFVDQTGAPADLCTLVNTGAVHEVWLVVSGDVPDAGFAETLEMKPLYDPAGNRLDSPPTRCAGNGCFDVDVPYCGRSLRILAINYTRGPGCALHSFGHGVEGMGTRDIVPGLDAWFESYAGFDLRARYGIPYGSMYELGCEDSDGNGEPDSTCAEYPLQDAAIFHNRGATSVAYPYDAHCGNVHFPPNATWHYDYGNGALVQSSCARFGYDDVASAVDGNTWSSFESSAPDCGGGFLIWWLRHMPRYSSGQSFPNGEPMRAMWPYLFY